MLSVGGFAKIGELFFMNKFYLIFIYFRTVIGTVVFHNAGHLTVIKTVVLFAL